MRRMQINLFRDEIKLGHNKSKKSLSFHLCNDENMDEASASWWREMGIQKRDEHLFSNKNQSCVFCLSSEDSETKFGEFLRHPYSGLQMHYFCLLLASGLTQRTNNLENIDDFVINKDSVCGFHIRDIMQEIKRASHLRCNFCRKQGASIGCVEASCKAKFHFACSLDHFVLSQFYDNFKSYCSKHRPKQVLAKVTKSDESDIDTSSSLKTRKKRSTCDRISKCPICLEDITCSIHNFHSLTTPCCSDIWLHRYCVQQQAYSSGAHFFRCPVCNDSNVFTAEMLRMGICIPERDASWELTHDAFTDLLQRHNQCDVEPCQCPHGRELKVKTFFGDQINFKVLRDPPDEKRRSLPFPVI